MALALKQADPRSLGYSGDSFSVLPHPLSLHDCDGSLLAPNANPSPLRTLTASDWDSASLFRLISTVCP